MALKQPFERIDFDEHSGKLKTSCAARIIGASCGAFLFCFASILITDSFGNGIEGLQAATYFWIGSLICGAAAGFFFPRVSHFLVHGFTSFIMILMAIMVGRSIGEQLALLGTFTFTEMIFLMSTELFRGNRQ